MISSFTGRIAARFAALVISTTAVVLAVASWMFWRQTIAGIDYLNRAEYIEIRDRLGPRPDALETQELERRMTEHAEIDASLYFFQVSNPRGEIFFRSQNMGHSLLAWPPGGDENVTVDLAGVGAVRAGTYRLGTLRLQIASPLEPLLRTARHFLQVSLVLLGLVAVASIGLGWQFARAALRPVGQIRETASRIRADNLKERIPVPPGRDELTALVTLLNQMFERLELSFDQISRFTADASHELKTPLAVIRLQAEKLRSRVASDSELATTCGELLEGIDELAKIVDVLLFLARAESGVLTPRLAEVDAENLVRGFSDDACVLAEDAGQRFVVARADRGPVSCEATLIRQLLLNVVVNALRVTPAGGVVSLESRLEDETWHLVVKDEGTGLPPEQLDRVMERFVRFAPTAGGAGHGLGLAICRTIAALHGGEIELRNRTDRPGLSVSVRLPRKRAQPEARHGTSVPAVV